MDHLGIKAELIGQIGELKNGQIEETRKVMGVLAACSEVDPLLSAVEIVCLDIALSMDTPIRFGNGVQASV